MNTSLNILEKPADNGETGPRRLDAVISDAAIAPDSGHTTEALSHIRAVAAGLRSLSTSQGANTQPETLEAMLRDAQSLRDICAASRWVVPEAVSLFLTKLVSSFASDFSRLNASTHRTCARALDFLRTTLTLGAQESLQRRFPLNIMVVDDDAVSRQAMLMALKVEGISVVSCDCAEDAIENLKCADFDLIFSDVMMPRINGFTLLPLIRDLPRHRRTPVVFVTGLSDFQSRAKSAASGGCDFVAKPIVPTEIVIKAMTFGLATVLADCAAQAHSDGTAFLRRSSLPPSAASEGSISPAPESPRAPAEPALLVVPAAAHSHDKRSGRHAPGKSRGFADPPHKHLAVLTLSQTGAILSSNKDALDLLGYEAEGLVSTGLSVLFPAGVQSEEGVKFLASLQNARRGLRLGPVNVKAHAKDGRELALSVTFSSSQRDAAYSSVLLLSSQQRKNQTVGNEVGSDLVTEVKPTLNMTSTITQKTPESVNGQSLPGPLPLPSTVSALRLEPAVLEHSESNGAQDKPEPQLASRREESRSLHERLSHVEVAAARAIEAVNRNELAGRETLSLFKQEFGAAIRGLKAELASRPARNNGAPSADPPTTVASMPPATPAPAPLVTPSDPATREIEQLRRQLERQRTENRNQSLIQALLCDQVRKLDPSGAND